MIRPSSKSSARSGATAVETAIVISLLVLFMFGIFEYGRFIMVRHLTDNAAREGARYAVVNTKYKSTDQIRDYTRARLAGQQGAIQNLTINIDKVDASGAVTGDWKNAAFGERVSVEVKGSYTPILPTLGILSESIPIKAKAVMRSEAP